MKTSEVLIKAKALLENVGWCQNVTAKFFGNDYATTPIAYCAHGAIIYTEQSIAGHLEALEILRSLTPERHTTRFNDAPGRTKEEILALYDAAIKVAEEWESKA